MNGERYPGESLPFEPSMRHADDRVIADKRLIVASWQNEPKMLNLFNAWRVLSLHSIFSRFWIWNRRLEVLDPRECTATGVAAKPCGKGVWQGGHIGTYLAVSLFLAH
jgi:hypothetical protein